MLHQESQRAEHWMVLVQQKRVEAYASPSVKPSEKNYPAHKLEFLALKSESCEKFKDYTMVVTLRCWLITTLSHMFSQLQNSVLHGILL